jgi:transcriptional regulator with XRE-family HTH domain
MDQRELWKADARLMVALRRERGWSRARLAQAAGVSHHTVAKIERGETVFPTTLDHVAAAFGLAASDIRLAIALPAQASNKECSLMQAVRDRYRLYQEALRRDDSDLLRREFTKGMTKNIRWVHGATRTLPWCGTYVGTEGVAAFFDAAFSMSQGLEQRCEELKLLDARRIVAFGAEVGAVPGVGRVTAGWIHLYEFERRGRLVYVHSSYDVQSIEPIAST